MESLGYKASPMTIDSRLPQMMTIKDSASTTATFAGRPTILLVEDEPDIAAVMRLNLERAGLMVEWSGSGEEALDRLEQPGIDLVLLDVILPGVDGHGVCQQIRANQDTKSIPVIMVTSLTEESDMIVGLGLGADDYIRKPFSGPELVARAKAAIRRGRNKNQPSDESDLLTLGDLQVDNARHACTISGDQVPLTMAEYRLLHFLMINPESAFTRQELLPHVVGEGVYVIDRNIDVHVRNLRKKIGDYAVCVVTVRGIGYRFDAHNFRG